MIFATLALASMCFASPKPVQVQEPVPFTRTYKAGDKAAYTVTGAIGVIAPGSTTVDIGLTVSKLLENGKAQVRTHMSNEQNTGAMQASPLPEDKLLSITDHNMPSGIGLSGIDEFLLFLFLAGSTVDKPVKAGEEYPWTWKGGAGTTKTGQTISIAFDGSTKVLEISAEKQQLRALIHLNMKMNGGEAGALTFTSTYSLADLSLVHSEGKFELGSSTVMEFKIARKQ